VGISNAKDLLRKAERAKPGLRQNLLIAAALSEVLTPPPVVVGGTAEEFWGGHQYHETDLDLVAYLTSEGRAALLALGFQRHGREWTRPGTSFVVEFPDTRIDGDVRLIEVARVGGGSVRIIGLDDLYVDRLKQAARNAAEEDIHFNSALAVATSRYVDINWTYVAKRVATTLKTEPLVGEAMRRINRRIRAQARRALSRPSPA
jgi:hypothetical protein